MLEQLKWWLPLSLALIFTYFLQINFFLHPDMLYLLHAAKAMYAGGTYTSQFFETNPPLILYLYTPALLLTQLSGLSILISFRLYILALSLLSLCICKYLSGQMQLDKRSQYVLMAALALSFLFLPAHEFGQREHLMMMLVFPYCFAAVLRLENKFISFNLALIIGLLAGLGIGLKPFFLTIPIAIESFLYYKKQSLLRTVRTETLALCSVLVIYMVYALWHFPDYFQTIIPLVARLYFPGTSASWGTYIKNIYVDFVLAGIASFAIMKFLRLPNRYPNINVILFLTLCAFTLAFSIPHSLFYYHLIPAFGTAYILLIFLVFQLPRTNQPVVAFSLILINFLIITAPLYAISYAYYVIYQSENDPYVKKLFQLFNTNQPNSSYLYLSSSVDSMIFNYYANGIYVGHYPSFWWELGMKQAQRNNQLQADEKYLVNLISRNLLDEKPRFVLMDTTIPATHEIRKIDYHKQFAKYSAFQKAWMQYHYLTTIGRFKIYEHNA